MRTPFINVHSISYMFDQNPGSDPKYRSIILKTTSSILDSALSSTEDQQFFACRKYSRISQNSLHVNILHIVPKICNKFMHVNCMSFKIANISFMKFSFSTVLNCDWYWALIDGVLEYVADPDASRLQNVTKAQSPLARTVTYKYKCAQTTGLQDTSTGK